MRVIPEGLKGLDRVEVGYWYLTDDGKPVQIHEYISYGSNKPYNATGYVKCSDGNNRVADGTYIGASYWGERIQPRCLVSRCTSDGSPFFSSPQQEQLELF